MPTIPEIHATTGRYSSVGILQSLIEKIPELSGVPMPTATTESIRAAGTAITNFASRRNAFNDGLINLIGMQRMHYMMFTNPLAWAKQGKLEMGETVEQIFIGLAKAHPFDPKKAETDFAKRSPAEIRSAFHTVNYRVTYDITVDYTRLKAAFLSMEGLQSFIEDMIGSVVRAATLDEFLITKYTIAVLLLAGKMPVSNMAQLSAATADQAVTTVTTVTNKFQFPSTKYNMAGVTNTCPVDDIYILESAEANALIKVNSLATAFNVDYVKFMGHVAMVDSFSEFDWDRLDMLMGYDAELGASPYDPGYRHFTEEELSRLSSIQIITMDKRFLQIYDNYEMMETPFINGEGGYTNYPYQVGKIFSASPFHNVVAFTTLESEVTNVSVTASTETAVPGTQVALTALVVTSGFASPDVVWSIPATDGVTVGQDGILYIGKNAAAGSVTVTATSKFDPTKSGTVDITIEA